MYYKLSLLSECNLSFNLISTENIIKLLKVIKVNKNNIWKLYGNAYDENEIDDLEITKLKSIKDNCIYY